MSKLESSSDVSPAFFSAFIPAPVTPIIAPSLLATKLPASVESRTAFLILFTSFLSFGFVAIFFANAVAKLDLVLEFLLYPIESELVESAAINVVPSLASVDKFILIPPTITLWSLSIAAAPSLDIPLTQASPLVAFNSPVFGSIVAFPLSRTSLVNSFILCCDWACLSIASKTFAVFLGSFVISNIFAAGADFWIACLFALSAYFSGVPNSLTDAISALVFPMDCANAKLPAPEAATPIKPAALFGSFTPWLNALAMDSFTLSPPCISAWDKFPAIFSALSAEILGFDFLILFASCSWIWPWVPICCCFALRVASFTSDVTAAPTPPCVSILALVDCCLDSSPYIAFWA